MAPHENDAVELLRQILDNQNDATFDKRKSRIELALAIGLPVLAVLGTAAAFYFNSQADIRQLQRDIVELKTAITTIAVNDRTRLQSEIERQQRELERLKK